MSGAGQSGRDVELETSIVLGLLAVAAEIPGEDEGIRLAGLRHQADHALEVEDVFFASASDVDRIAGGSGRRQDAGKRRAQTIAERLDQQPARDKAVGGERHVTSAIAGDRDPAAGGLVWRK